MSVPFRPEIFGATSNVWVEFAFGADLSADPATWTWYDVTSDVIMSTGLNGSYGRQDETSQTTPASMSLSLLNTSGNYTAFGYSGSYGENVVAGTPGRVRRQLNGGTIIVEFEGPAIGFTPSWDTTGTLPIINVELGGYLRILGQPDTPAVTPLLTAVMKGEAVAYWPMDDATLIHGFVSATGGHNGRTSSGGAIVAANVAGPVGAPNPLPNFTAGGTAQFYLDPVSAGSQMAVEFLIQIAADADESANPKIAWIALEPTANLSDIILNANAGGSGGLTLTRVVSGTSTVDTSGIDLADGLTHQIRVVVTRVVTVCTIVVQLDGVAVITSASFADPFVLACPYGITLNGDRSLAFTMFGHLAVYAPYGAAAVTTDEAVVGYTGELAHDRMTRICDENSIGFNLNGTSNIAMGPQLIASPLENLRDCEKSDGGVLYDGFAWGVNYICRSSRYSTVAALVIDAGSGKQLAPPFAPVHDDQKLVNQFTASRSSGGSVTVADTTSPLRTGRIGVWPGSDTYNVADDTYLSGLAGWRVNLGTVYGLRYPTLSLNFISAQGAPLAPTWLTNMGSARPISFRINVTNVSTSAVNHPVGTLALIVEGYTVTSDTQSWNVTANCASWLPNNVGKVGTSLRVDADSSTLAAAATSTATSLLVGNPRPWTTTAAFPADFPFDVGPVAGEQMTVSAIASSITDSFTRTTSSGWGTPTTTPGAVWTVAAGVTASIMSTTGTLASIAAPQSAAFDPIMLIDVGTTTWDVKIRVKSRSNPAGGSCFDGLIAGYVDANNLYYLDVQTATTGAMTANIAIFNAAAFSTLVSEAIPQTLPAGDLWLRASANAATGLLSLKVWQDGTTEPYGWTVQIVDTTFTSTKVGVYAYRNGTTPTAQTFDDFEVLTPQTFTVARSVNGVVKAQTAGTKVSLYQPAKVAL